MTGGRRIALGAAALVVVLLLAGATAFTVLLSPDALRARLVDAVRRSTGRELTIAGPVGVDWSLEPRMVLHGVSLSNPPGMSRPAMASAAQVEARMALLPLLSRRVEVRSVTVVAPDVLLERDAAGRPNWVFTPPAAPPGATTAPSTPGPRMQVAVDMVEMRDARVGWRGGNGVVTVLAPRLTAKGAGPGQPVSFGGALTTGGLEINVQGAAGPFTAAAWPVQATATTAGATVTAKGSVGGSGLDLAVAARVPDLAALGAPAGVALPPVRDLALDAQVSAAEAGAVSLRALRVSAPQGDVSGDIVLSWAPRPFVRGALASQRLDVPGLLALRPPPAPAAALTAPPSPAPPLSVPPSPAAVNANPAPVLPDTPLPFAALRRVDADLHLALNEVAWRRASVRAAEGQVSLHDGRLRLDRVRAKAPGGAVEGSLAADAAAQSVALTLRAPGLQAGPLMAVFGTPNALTGRLDADVRLSGAGSSVRAIAATLDGHAGLALVDGEVDNGGLAGLLGPALRGLPAELGGRSAVRCLALRLDAAHGQATTRAMLLDASRLRLDGEGGVSLADETLDLRLHTLVRVGGTWVAVPVHLLGPWRSPRPEVTASGPGRDALVIGAAPGPDACPAQLALARDGRAGPMPAAEAAAGGTSRLPKPADLLRSLLR